MFAPGRLRALTLTLTPAGRGYVGQIRRAFETMSDATATLRPEPRHLTISVTPTFATRWLIPRLPSLTEAHPDIDLRIHASERVSNFQSDGVDLAVRLGRAPFGPSLTADLLFEQVIVAVASPLLVEKLGPLDRPGTFPTYALLHDAHDIWPAFLEPAFPKGAPPTLRNIRFNQTSLAIEAAIAGQGLALASLIFVATIWVQAVWSGRCRRNCGPKRPSTLSPHANRATLMRCSKCATG